VRPQAANVMGPSYVAEIVHSLPQVIQRLRGAVPLMSLYAFRLQSYTRGPYINLETVIVILEAKFHYKNISGSE